MTLVYKIIFLLTAITVIIFDYKIQKIPVILILINYCSICLLINPYLLAGIILIAIIKYINKPVDIVYILTLCSGFLLNQNLLYGVCIIPIILQTILSKKDKISLMVSIELAFICFFVIRRFI